MPACVSCGADNLAIARFCHACGVAQSLVCAGCGTTNPPHARFCIGCGSALGAPVPARAPAPPEAADAPRAAVSERRPITVVFVDMVGSTSRAESLDPEDVLALLEPYYARLRGVLERHGGVVEKFIGDAVVALFGAPVAHEDDPERAVRSGLAIIDAIEALNVEDPARELEVRVGIATGEAIVALDTDLREGKGMAWGDVLNIAARLQSNAPVGGVLLDERTSRAVASVVELRDTEPIAAKGKAEPVPVRLAVGLLEPTELDGRRVSPFVGREAELERLLGLWRDVGASELPAAAVVTGEPGLGKTRLLREATSRMDGAVVHRGRCLSYGEGITYWPVAEMVRGLAGILTGDTSRTISAKLDALIESLPLDDVDQLRTIAAALSNLVGAPTTPRGTYVASQISQAELHWGIRRTFELLAVLRPRVLWLDDLHWAEPTLVELVLSLLDAEGSILVVATARPEISDGHPALVEIGARRTTIWLTALGREESGALVGDLAEPLADRGLDPAAIERLVDHARGNPLFLEQTVQMLLDAETPAVTAMEALAVPDSLQALVGARLDALPPAERHLAQHSSVAGMVFWSGAAARLDERTSPPDELLSALGRRALLAEHEVSSLVGEREWEFTHAVIHDVAYGRLPKGRRVALHVRFAAWVDEVGSGGDEFVEILAYHLEQACLLSREVGRTDVPAPVEQAVAALERAGQKAELREGVREASRFYMRALELAGPEQRERRLELRLRLARTTVAVGELRDAAAELEEIVADATELGRRDVHADALIALGNVRLKQGLATEATERLAQAEEIAGEHGDRRLRIRAAYEAAWADSWFHGAIDEPVAKLRAALDLAELEHDLPLRIEGHLRLGMLLLNAARLEEAGEPLLRCSILSSETGSVRDDARATYSLGCLRYYRGETADAERLLLRAQEWFERTDDTLFTVQNLRVLAVLSLEGGQPAVAEARLREALPAATGMGGWIEAEVTRLLIEALVAQGRTGEAQELADATLADVPAEDPNSVAVRRLADGCLAAANGRVDDARAAHLEAIRLLEEVEAWVELGEARLALASVLRDAGDAEAARAELEQARSTFERIGALGPLGRVAGELTRLEQAASVSDA